MSDSYCKDCGNYGYYQHGHNDGIADAVEKINEILSEIERHCVSHTENECGEWTLMTVNYSNWADAFIELRKLKEKNNV